MPYTRLTGPTLDGTSLSVILVLACSLANGTPLRPAGVHGWLQVAAMETAVSETDVAGLKASHSWVEMLVSKVALLG